ncbi:hypothetical protein CLOP_g5937 [Closterium sp. NIES-67]|nr:hypothetical protein CLOP_g5937 [Closterium sp. NIES-67]
MLVLQQSMSSTRVTFLNPAESMEDQQQTESVNSHQSLNRQPSNAVKEGSFSFEERLPVRYNTSVGTVEGKLNVHLIAHSHDDLGWVKTIDEYYIDQVQYIIETVVDQLSDNPDRKFIQVEQGFFFLWWQQQKETMRDKVRKLVASGQLEFMNGGWVMHDEAVCHYTDMVHQMSMGHRFIQENFNITPRIAWQIDPFGHSATQASLITSQAGLDGFIFGRADYQDMEARKASQKMEFVWRAGTGAPRETEVFAGILYDGYYSPQEFRYQQTDSPQYRLRDWPNARDPNVRDFVNFFVQETTRRAQAFRTNHLLFPMGEDFSFDEAIMWFKNMDKLIHYVNLDGRVNALYSTPSFHLDALHKEKKTWPLKTGDMFPYADAPHSVWTGYFASRANFKRYARVCSSLLLATTVLEAAVGKRALRDWGLKNHRMIATDEFLFDNHLGKKLKFASGGKGGDIGSAGATGEGGSGGGGGVERGTGGRGGAQEKGEVDSGEWEEWESLGGSARRRRVASTFPLEEAVAVAQHHDAITGTAQQHVNDDYTLRLHRAAQEGFTIVTAALVHLITQAAPTPLQPRPSSPASAALPNDPSRAFYTPTAEPTGGPSDFPPFNSQPGSPVPDPAAEAQAVQWTSEDPFQPHSFTVDQPNLPLANPLDPSMPGNELSDPLFSQIDPALTQVDPALTGGEQQQMADGTAFFPYNRQVPPVEEIVQPEQTTQQVPDQNPQEQPPSEEAASLGFAAAAAAAASAAQQTFPPRDGTVGLPGRRGQEMLLSARDGITGAENSGVVGGSGGAGGEGEVRGEGIGSGSSSRGRRLLREGGVVRGVRDGREDSARESAEGGDRRRAAEGGMPVLDFQMCPLLNLSYCPPSQTNLGQDQVLVVTVFNPLGWPRAEVVRFPVSSSPVLVTDSTNSPIPAQIVIETLVPLNTRATYIAAYTGELPQEAQQQQQPQKGLLSVVFHAEVPPLGYATFFLTAVPPGTQGAAIISTAKFATVPAHQNGPAGTPSGNEAADSLPETIVLGGFKAAPSPAGGGGGASGGTGGGEAKANTAGEDGDAALRVTFSKSAYGMTHMELVRPAEGGQEIAEVAKPVRSDVLDYVTAKGGAYIFDPSGAATSPTDTNGQVPIYVQRGPIVEEFSRQIAPWVSETFRVYPGCDYAELHYAIGPVPEGAGHEVVSRFSAAISTNETFFTDSNGRQYLKRVLNYRSDWTLALTDPIAGNFYPVTVGAFIGDGAAQLSLLVDRAAGAASLADGQLEVMLHRALATVDMKGVGEVLNEAITVNGNTERLMVIGSLRFGLHTGGSTAEGGKGGMQETPGGSDSRHLSAGTAAHASAEAAAGAETNPSFDSGADATGGAGTGGGSMPAVQQASQMWPERSPHGRRGAERAGEEDNGEAIQDSSEMRRTRGRRGGEREVVEEQQGGQGAEWRREHAQRLIAPLQLAFAVESKEAIKAAEGTYRWRYSLSQRPSSRTTSVHQPAYSLPPNVAVISFQELSPREIVLRLAHLYEAYEHPTLSKIGRVDLRQLLSSQKIKGVVELSLMANQKRSEMRRPMKWHVDGEDPSEADNSKENSLLGGPVDPTSLVVELAPGEIRTFSVKLSPP